MTYHSSKTYGHEVGLSCAFRQWRAVESHCSKIHGYAIAVKLEFEAEALDHRNWVIDFGGLKEIKQYLVDNFDHKLLVANDDPDIDWFHEADHRKMADVIFVDHVGCEAFAQMIYEKVASWLFVNNHHSRVYLSKVTVSEHGANSASYTE